MKSKKEALEREEIFWAFFAAVQAALETAPETAIEAIEDTFGPYLEALEAEGLEEEIPPGEAWLLVTEVCPISKRQEAALTSVGEALRDFVQAEETPQAEAKFSETVTENKKALKQAGLSVFVPKGKGFKEIE